MSQDWPNIADLLPHSGVARLLTRIVSASPTELRAAGSIPALHPLVSDRAAPAFLAIELGAQAAAAMEAIGRAATGLNVTPQAGSLVRIREATFSCTSLPIDTPIDVTAELIGSAPPLAIYRVHASLNGDVVVRTVISTHAGPAGERS